VRIIIECPENILHLEAGYIYADCLFAQLQTSCSPAADHTFATVTRYVPVSDDSSDCQNCQLLYRGAYCTFFLAKIPLQHAQRQTLK